MCLNNAKLCYNRIIHFITSLWLQQLGIPKNVTKNIFLKLSYGKYFIWMAYSISNAKYAHKNFEIFDC